jgi:hypothetical protein
MAQSVDTVRRPHLKRHGFAVGAYVLATFGVQALSHFVVNTDHYAAITWLRDQPIFPLGVLSMLIQGFVLSVLHSRTTGTRGSLGHALTFAWLAGAYLVSYPALAEPAKYAVPATGSWIGVEAVAGFAQFTIYGILLGLADRGGPPR